MTANDNTTFNNQKFGLSVYYGTVKIDNITILDQVCTPDELNVCLSNHTSSSISETSESNSSSKSTPGFEWYIVIPIDFTLILFIKRRK